MVCVEENRVWGRRVYIGGMCDRVGVVKRGNVMCEVGREGIG